jgi:hypothetical protein
LSYRCIKDGIIISEGLIICIKIVTVHGIKIRARPVWCPSPQGNQAVSA